MFSKVVEYENGALFNKKCSPLHSFEAHKSEHWIKPGL